MWRLRACLRLLGETVWRTRTLWTIGSCVSMHARVELQKPFTWKLRGTVPFLNDALELGRDGTGEGRRLDGTLCRGSAGVDDLDMSPNPGRRCSSRVGAGHQPAPQDRCDATVTLSSISSAHCAQAKLETLGAGEGGCIILQAGCKGDSELRLKLSYSGGSLASER